MSNFNDDGFTDIFLPVTTVAKVYLITIFTGEMQQTATMIEPVRLVWVLRKSRHHR